VKRSAFVLLNRVSNWIVMRLRLRRFRGGDLLQLTTTGRKTGQRRTVPLLTVRDGDAWIVAASNGGADWEPGWWLNLQAGGGGVVEFQGRRTQVAGEELTGPAREEAWRRLNEQLAAYEGYQAKVRRTIAVVRLTPVGA
jgi:deazaflavin-dependent oxidoreductase (nitroreductase family)